MSILPTTPTGRKTGDASRAAAGLRVHETEEDGVKNEQHEEIEAGGSLSGPLGRKAVEWVAANPAPKWVAPDGGPEWRAWLKRCLAAQAERRAEEGLAATPLETPLEKYGEYAKRQLA